MTTRKDWQRDAQCVGMPTNLFFDAEHEAEAVRVCAGCPVADTCLEEALTEGARQWGVRGGMTAEERVSERRRRIRSSEITVDRTRASEEAKVGVTRRLQALAAAGVGTEAISQATGINRDTLAKTRKGEARRMYQRTVDAVREAYPYLLTLPELEQAFRARSLAARHGWLGPEAWEGVDIDDPDAQPRTHVAAA